MFFQLFKLYLLIIFFIQGTIEDELAELKQQVKQLQQNVVQLQQSQQTLTDELNEIKDFNEFNSVCPMDWISYLNTKCFKFLEESQTEIESKGKCKQLDEKSTLVTILSNEEQIFLSNNLKNYSDFSDRVWIGLELKNNSYQWLDGNELNFTNWDENAKQKDDCVHMSLLRSSLGKWSDESCNKRYSSVCQKKLSKQSKIIQKLLNLTETDQFYQDEINQNKYRIDLQENQIESQNNEFLEMNKTLEEYYKQINSLIPIGFLYTQLPHQSSPEKLWPNTKWTEITSQYSGLFFRAEGGESLPFEQTQQANQSFISDISFHGCGYDSWEGFHWDEVKKTSLKLENWIDVAKGGYPGRLEFFTTGGEVRPKNTAIKIFKRIQ